MSQHEDFLVVAAAGLWWSWLATEQAGLRSDKPNGYTEMLRPCKLDEDD